MGSKINMTKILIELFDSSPELGSVASILEVAEQLKAKGHNVYFCGSLKNDFIKICEQKGLSNVPLNSISISKIKFIQYAFNCGICLLKLKKLRPDVIIQNYNGWGQSLSLTAKILGIPVLARAGTSYDSKNPSNKWINGYLAYNKFHARKLLNSPLADKVHITGHPFTPWHLTDGKNRSVRYTVDQEINFLFLGQLSERKGLTTLVKAFAQMKGTAKLQIIGGNWASEGYPQTVKRLIYDLRIEDRVELMNFQTDVQYWLSQAHAFVFPSRDDTHPRVIKEAMFIGLPIIAANSGGIPEMIENNISGMLIELDNIDALSDAMDKIASSNKLRQSLGEMAKKICQEKLHNNRAVDEYEEVINKLINSDRKSI